MVLIKKRSMAFAALTAVSTQDTFIIASYNNYCHLFCFFSWPVIKYNKSGCGVMQVVSDGTCI